MIIDTKPQHIVESSGELETTTFSIKQSAKAFVVLSSSLYKDKIRSIIRELSSNARDSHVDANKVDVPFDVHLPTAIEPEFWIRDYGTGLDDDGIKNIYTKYFESTKENTNDAVGCLGLGSKSPFAYTQSFMVTAWFNGTKRIYSVFINDFSEPSIAKMLETETDEPNGVEVRFNVPATDKDKFIFAARRVYTWFNLVKPNFIGQQIHFSTYIEQKSVKDIVLTRHKISGSVNKCSVIMGEVEYPVDITNPSVQEIKQINDVITCMDTSYNSTVSITVPIGAVDFAPSREDLQYTKKTLDALKKYFSDAKKNVEAMIPKFDESTIRRKTFREACNIIDTHIVSVNSVASSFGISMFARKVIKELNKVKLELLSVTDHEVINKTVINGQFSVPREHVSSLNTAWVKSTHIILADVTGDFLNEYTKANPNDIPSLVSLLPDNGIGKRVLRPDEVVQYRQLFVKLGFSVILASDLLKVKLKDRKYHTLYVTKDKKNSFSRASADGVKIIQDDPINVYWVPISNKVMNPKTHYAVDHIELAKLVGMPFTVVGIYEPSSIDVSMFKTFDEYFVKDLDRWMASAPNRNAFTINRVHTMAENSKKSYMYGVELHMYNEVMRLAGIDPDKYVTPTLNDIYTVSKTSGISGTHNTYTRLSGVDRFNSAYTARELGAYPVKALLTVERFPLTAFKDKHMFQVGDMHQHIANFNEQFSSLCKIFSNISDTEERTRVIIESGVKILSTLKQFN